MAGMVDACSSSDDHAHPEHWSGLAAVCSGLKQQSLFSPTDHFLAHPWHHSPHSFALAPGGALARRTAGHGRRPDGVAIGVFHRPAGELLHLPLSAVIIVASILFSQRIAYLTAASSFLLLAGMTALAYAGRIPRTFSSLATTEGLRTWLVMNLLGFFAVAYLASLLAQSLRKKGVELEEKREELLSLQDFTEDIIHSMRGGLITTDLTGRIL